MTARPRLWAFCPARGAHCMPEVTGRAIPHDATLICREGDETWTPAARWLAEHPGYHLAPPPGSRRRADGPRLYEEDAA